MVRTLLTAILTNSPAHTVLWWMLPLQSVQNTPENQFNPHNTIGVFSKTVLAG